MITPLQLLDKLPWMPLVIGALALGLAPFTPQPHLFEKIAMLVNGALTRPIDIFDLCLHGILPLLVVLKVLRGLVRK